MTKPILLKAGLLTAGLLAALSLAGCKKAGIDEKNASPEEVAKKVGASEVRPQPGRWEVAITMDAMDMPNLPEQARAAMRQSAKRTQTAASCLTPEQAAKPDARFFQQTAKGCTYDHFTMSGGKIDARMICKGEAHNQVMTMTGSYTPTSYDLKVAADGAMAPGQPMSMRMSMKARRVGECTGKEDG
jgi:hypothetical protein